MAVPRIDFGSVAPEGRRAMFGLEHYVRNCGLEHSLLGLIKVRASQMNGCAFCIDMHTKDARLAGETEQRLYLLSAWREAPCYSERERAALAWTEAVTRISPESSGDALYGAVREHFTEKEVADLTLAIVAINGWNRLMVSFRTVPGSYQPQAAERV